MKMKLLLNSFLIGLIFLSNNIVAQTIELDKGYLVTNKSDTLKGFFDLKLLGINRINFNNIN